LAGGRGKVGSLLGEDWESELEYEELDIYYEGEERGPEGGVAAICRRPELVRFTTFLAARIVNDALNKGIRIIFDVEPVLYESVFSLYAISVYCSTSILTEENGVVLGTDGKRYRPTFSLFKMKSPDENEIVVVFMREKPEKFWDDFEVLTAQPRLVFFIVTRGRPEVPVSTAVYFRNLAPELVRETLRAMSKATNDESWERKERYIGRVPFDVLLHFPLDTVMQISKTWTPPPPPNTDYLHKRPRSLSELVLPDSLKRRLWRFVRMVEKEGGGSLLLVGLPASGRKTIAVAIAAELGLPAYHVSIANILSRWVGESESKLKAVFEGMRARGGVIVFENVESLFRKTAGESVTPNLRTVLYQEMARDDNNFVAVFTSNEDAAPELFASPLIGEVKLVVPPPGPDERRELARMFLLEILGSQWDKLVEVAKRQYDVEDERAESLIFNLYANSFAGACVGMTSGELYRTMRKTLVPAVDEMLRTGKLVPIDEDIIDLSRRDYTAIHARLKTLKAKAISLGLMDVADAMKKVESEVIKKAMETSEKMSKYKEY